MLKKELKRCFKEEREIKWERKLKTVNPFHATDVFGYPPKISENQRFSDVFRGYQKRPVA